MNVLILGAGEVGFHIAQRLASEGNNVSVIDNNAARLQRVADTMDVKTVLGHATHPSVLAQAGADNAELLIAATTNDETNMLACQVAHSLFKVTTKMARIRETDYVNHPKLFGRDELPIDLIISPETEAAKSIVKRFQISAAVDAQEFADGKVQLLGMRIPPKGQLAGVALSELHEVLGDLRTYVVAHEHNRCWCVPQPETVLLSGDSIYLAVAGHDVDRLLECISPPDEHAKSPSKRNVLIVGGGHVGYIVACQLEKLGVSIKLIEHNELRAEWLAEHLDSTVVIHGDALDRQLLEEEVIDNMDDFLALTNDDETNILGSLIAKKYKIPHIVTLVNRAIYSDLTREMGLEITVSPRLTTASAILRHVRKGRIFGLSSLGDGTLEVLEAEALKTSAILDTPLSALKLPENTVIGAIIRGDKVIIPDGDSMVEANDHVLLISQGKALRDVEKLFEVSLEFF
ncbi:MAG: Trk system potassium transporter TrkA [Mariprofundaceae bacterium]|nr:Trk system potassium transporter TrkA [Mariprofundaceae bacterium]